MRWKGYTDADDTWYPLKHLKHASVLVENYDDRHRLPRQNPSIKKTPAKGDLVLVWKHSREKDMGRELESKWTRLFRVVRVLHHGRSAVLEDWRSCLPVEKYHIDYLKRLVCWAADAMEEAEKMAVKSRLLREEYNRCLREQRKRKGQPPPMEVEPLERVE